jgi:uncharacterized linocin/CFP29 family protein
MNRIGNATGTLTDYEVNLIETQITKTIRPMLVGRTLMPTRSLGNAGITKTTFYTENDMGQALISMTGEEESMDFVDLSGHEVKVPIISKDYKLHWRDVLARRNGGEDLNTANAVNAARQIAEEEDKLILTGEYTGWPALGIEGLANATGRNTVNGGDWSSDYITDTNAAIAELETDGFYGPYKMIINSTFYSQLRVLVGTTDTFAFQVLEDLLGGPGSIVVSNNLLAAAGTSTNTLLIDTSPGNFELGVGADVSTYLTQLPSMNYQGKVWEAVVPIIKRPAAICEINTQT